MKAKIVLLLTVGVLGVFAGVSRASIQKAPSAGAASDCCVPGATCCVPGAECCE